jgi:TetR/AcrR family acrAB operon transcriptional repressor
VLQIATHQVEYTADMGAVLERHLKVHDGCVARNHVALERAFAARSQPPPVALDCAARGLQVLVEGLVNQWLLNPGAFDLLANGRAALTVYLAGLGLQDSVPT